MKQYHDLINHILEYGEDVNDRTGTGTRSVFGYQMRFNLQDGFPAVTTKRLAWKSVVGELLWFLEGSTDERRLAELTFGKDRTELVGKHTIWTANADKQGRELGYVNNDFTKHLGPIYGYQWRKRFRPNPMAHQRNTIQSRFKTTYLICMEP
jgi:thymidylate synthase